MLPDKLKIAWLLRRRWWRTTTVESSESHASCYSTVSHWQLPISAITATVYDSETASANAVILRIVCRTDNESRPPSVTIYVVPPFYALQRLRWPAMHSEFKGQLFSLFVSINAHLVTKVKKHHDRVIIIHSMYFVCVKIILWNQWKFCAHQLCDFLAAVVYCRSRSLTSCQLPAYMSIQQSALSSTVSAFRTLHRPVRH